MHRESAQLKIALLTCACVCACTRKPEAERRPRADSFVGALSSAQTALQVSEVIRKAKPQSCDVLGDGLTALETRTWDDAVLRGLVEEIVQKDRGLCLPGEPSSWAIGSATSLARSLLETEPSAGLAVLESAPKTAVILRRRAELLFATGETTKGRIVLIDSLALDDDEEVRAHATRLLRLAGEFDKALALSTPLQAGEEGDLVRGERITTLAAMGRRDKVIAELAGAEIHLRPELAAAAVSASPDVLALTRQAGAGVELLLAASRVQGLSPEQVVDLLRRGTSAAPENADAWIALANAEEAGGQLMAAIAAWDRAAGIAHGAERPVLASIRLLRESGNGKEALARANTLAQVARSEKNSDYLRLASQGFRYAGDAERAVALVREALALRPGDGRLQSELAHRLEDGGNKEEAAKVLATLLVCGARGRPWHRHEIVARLAGLVGQGGVARAVAAVPCQAVDADALTSMIQ